MPVYALGSNGSGQLGLNHDEDASSPTRLPLPASFSSSSVQSIAAGGNHTLLLTKFGNVWASGSQPTQSLVFRPIRLPSLSTQPRLVNLCAATWDASIFVTANGQVLVCGAGAKGELGLGQDRPVCEVPTELSWSPPAGTEVIEVKASMGHVIVVLSNGHVYGWGNGRQGQLGEPAEVVWQPRRIENVSFVVERVVCGKDFTCLFSEPGLGQLKLLGPKKRDTFSLQANTPATLLDWVDVQATWGSVLVLDSARNTFGWGRNDHGQLPPKGLPPLKEICGGSEHVLALTSSGQVLAWGWGEHGNCGLPLDVRKDVNGGWNTLDVKGRVLRLGAGCATSWIITSDEGS